MADRIIKTITTLYLLAGAVMLLLSCEVKVPDFIRTFFGLLPLRNPVSTHPAIDSLSGRQVVYRFFDDAYMPAGFHYTYPEASKIVMVEGSAKNGKAALQFALAADDYSGGSVCLNNTVYDLKPLIKKAALQFWIRGEAGNELATVALVDEDRTDGRKTVVRVPIHWFGPVTKEWSLISIPLENFIRLNEHGLYWDESRREEVRSEFDWSRVAEFRIEVKKDENDSFCVWVDDIFIVKMGR